MGGCCGSRIGPLKIEGLFRPAGAYRLLIFTHGLRGCGKSRRGQKSSPQALKRGHIFSDLAARLKLGPSQNLRESYVSAACLRRGLHSYAASRLPIGMIELERLRSLRRGDGWEPWQLLTGPHISNGTRCGAPGVCWKQLYPALTFLRSLCLRLRRCRNPIRWWRCECRNCRR